MEGHTDGQTKANLHTLGMVCVGITIVSWSFGPSLSARVTSHPLVSTFVRMTAAAVLQWGISIAIGKPPSFAILKRTFLPGALFCLNNVLFFFAIQRASVANITLLVSLQPVLVILLAKPLFGEVVRKFDVVCTLIALGGAAFAILGANSGGKTTRTTLFGATIALGSMLAFCGYFLFANYQNAHQTDEPPHPLTYMTAIITAAAITSAPFLVITGHATGVAHLTRSQLSALAWVVVVPTLGHLAITFAHRHVDASLSSLTLLIQPMSSAFVAWWLLGQRVVVEQIIGAIVVIIAIAAVTLRRRALSTAVLAAIRSDADSTTMPAVVAGD
jgi:drug/metabolite transporter (DMT)-like permease